MHRLILIATLLCATVVLRAQTSHPQQRRDSVPQVEGDTLRELIVTKDRRLPIFVSPEKKKPQQPRVPNVSDIIGRKATDMIMHPFAFAQRKSDKRKRKARQKLWEYEQIKTDEDLIRAALLREGIDPDSILHARDSIMGK